MNRVIFAALAALLTAAAFAQTSSGGLNYSQPWNYLLPAYESRVVACTSPQPLAHISMDDFIAQKTGAIVRINWWGTLTNIAQGSKYYYIAIYKDNGQCYPIGFITAPFYAACAKPTVVKKVGKDCQNKPVYWMSAPLPVAFSMTAGQHYWLQISESDADSVVVGQEDFRWSGHRPVQNCRALQSITGTTGLSFLPANPCDQSLGKDDLAFELIGYAVTGTVWTRSNVPIPGGSYMVDFFPHGNLTGGPVKSMCIQPDDQGRFAFDPEIIDGNYDVRISGNGNLSELIPAVLVAEGSEFAMPTLHPRPGDVNGDGIVDDTDLLAVINNFLEVGH